MKKLIISTVIGIISLCSPSAKAQIPNTNITLMGWYIGTNLFPVSGGTNFWLNLNITYPRGYYIYHSIKATNNVNFLGVTNPVDYHLISVDVLAFGANRVIGIPTNLPHINTNGLVNWTNRYELTLSNGNEFRITVKTNANGNLSTLWSTFGQ